MRWTLSIVLCVISLPVLASAWVNVTVSTPANNSTVTSPVLIAASATSDRNITGWRIYVDGTSVYHTGSTNSIRTSISMAPGTHKVIIRAWASNGTYGSATLTETVGSSTPTPTPTPSPTPSPSPSPTPTGTTCSGATYYVSNSGNDSNNGVSTSSPWKTAAKVVAFEPSLRQGDCVLFQRGGVWNEQLAISNVHGSQSYPITFGNYGSGNLPVLDGGSTRPYGIVGASASGQTANSYVTIDGFEVRNTTSGGIIFSYLVQPGITIRNNYVHNNGYGAYAGACAGCFQVDGGSYGYNEAIAMVCYPKSSCGTKILNNTVKIEGGHNSIMVDSDLGSPLIQGNKVGPGISHGGIDVKRSVGAMVKQNTVNCSVSVVVNGQTYPGCNATSFWTEQDDATFTETGTYEQNISYGAGRGYACFGANGVAAPISLNYYNNTCYLGTSGANATDLTSCRGGTLKFENNIFSGSGGISLGTCSAVTWDYNDKYGTAGGPSGAHDMSVNPLFLNPSTMDFHLQSTSPVLNSGSSSILGLSYIGACGTSGNCP
jgi:hypothetical protein